MEYKGLNQYGIVFNNNGPGVLCYKHAALPPDLVYNLIEDIRNPLDLIGLKVTEQDFLRLVTYDPDKTRLQRFRDLMNSRLKGSGEEKEGVEQFTIGSANLADEWLSRFDRSFDLENIRLIALRELEKGFNSWCNQARNNLVQNNWTVGTPALGRPS